ncbi:IclR family transcriptional regulator [Nocardioides sp. cx-173]|uniref:IclR family transcriptional regulator n=1 Tax=Nocardioides sp. cx-173 TaxID=2898796 RepID=UPI001E65236A|nr:IclR family transcriptional regulator [Nocardioides sp. cx-173]MCD4524208.1 IclR family transcriptional regulator [Nocardioides sp. cx-173]UGB41600.1 IclR family transcriptional regulator [Nocardioides sp. cx-173]
MTVLHDDLLLEEAETDAVVRPLRPAESPDRTVLGRLDLILHAFGGNDGVLALSEMSRRVNLPKSTVHRLADQMCAVGWLERKSGGYRVGLKLLDLGGVALQRNGLRDVAFRHIHALAVKTGLGVQLALLDQSSVVYLDCIVLGRFKLPTRVGGREPAYCTGLGKAMLAFEDKDTQLAALQDMPRRTASTVVDPREMQTELANIRRVQVAHDREEAYRGLGCVAAPILANGRAIGAISVSGPVGQIQARWLAQHVRDTALAISERGPSAAPVQRAPHGP